MADLKGEKRAAAEAAAQLVQDGMSVGLGTGSTVAELLPAIAARGLTGIRCVATSVATEGQARKLGLPLERFDSLTRLDVAIDGTDHTLGPDDVTLALQPLEGYEVEAEAGHAVALQLELDDELRREGLAAVVLAVACLAFGAGIATTGTDALGVPFALCAVAVFFTLTLLAACWWLAVSFWRAGLA